MLNLYDHIIRNDIKNAFERKCYKDRKSSTSQGYSGSREQAVEFLSTNARNVNVKNGNGQETELHVEKST